MTVRRLLALPCLWLACALAQAQPVPTHPAQATPVLAESRSAPPLTPAQPSAPLPAQQQQPQGPAQARGLPAPVAVPAANGMVGIPALDSPVVDTTGTLDAATVRQLEQQALALQRRKGSQLQVLMIPSTQPETIEQYAVRVFEQWKLGRRGVDDGVLLIVAKDDRKARIEVGYGLEGAIPDITAGRVIQEYLVPRFRQGDYGGGLVDATGQLVKLIDGEPLPEPVADNPTGESRGGDWIFALIAAFIVANVLRAFFGGMPAGVRALVTGAGAGGIAWVLSSALLVGGIGAFIGFWLGLFSMPRGRFARDSGWGGYGGGPIILPGGGGGWGGGGFGGGGGWSGGGGMSGGGGASGGW